MAGEAQAVVRAERDETAEERSIVLALGDETHTLGNTLRDVMWAHPHIQLASYTQEHPSMNEIVLRCQTSGAITAEQAMGEALHMTKDILQHMADTMQAAAAEWEQRSGGQQQQQPEAMDDDSG